MLLVCRRWPTCTDETGRLARETQQMEVWYNDKVGESFPDEPILNKKPTIVTLIDGDEISLRARHKKQYIEIELSSDDLFRICKETLTKNILTWEQEQKLLKLINR